jgi:hypothetical protein
MPLLFLATNTLYGGFLNIRDNFWPLTSRPDSALVTQGYILSICTGIMIVLALVVLGAAIAKWASVLSGTQHPVASEG